MNNPSEVVPFSAYSSVFSAIGSAYAVSCLRSVYYPLLKRSSPSPTVVQHFVSSLHEIGKDNTMIKQEINQSVNHVSCLRPTELHLCCIGNESSEIFLLQFFSAKYETITCDWKQWLCTALSLKTSVTNSCWNEKSYFQETAPSFHLNCLTAQGEELTSLWVILKMARCESYSFILTAAGDPAALAWLMWKL